MLLEINDLVKKYPHPSRLYERRVLDKISLSARAGDAIAITGPSGSGKTTLLNIIGALDQPDSGKVILDGRNLADQNERQLARIRNQDIGFIFQLHHLLPQCNVLENVLLPTLPFGPGLDHQSITARAQNLLERVGLKEFTNSFPYQLSGGELQRVAAVRALINRPKLILADEPTGALDPDSAADLCRLLTELNREEKTSLIIATHSTELARTMDKVFQLKKGKLNLV